MTNFNSVAKFDTKAEALEYLAMFDYRPIPVRNRWSNNSFGDNGEHMVGFAHIQAHDEYQGEKHVVTGYSVHTTEFVVE